MYKEDYADATKSGIFYWKNQQQCFLPPPGIVLFKTVTEECFNDLKIALSAMALGLN